MENVNNLLEGASPYQVLQNEIGRASCRKRGEQREGESDRKNRKGRKQA